MPLAPRQPASKFTTKMGLTRSLSLGIPERVQLSAGVIPVIDYTTEWPDSLKILIGGQSNASGRGVVAGGEAPSTLVQLFGNDYNLKQATEPIDNWTDRVDMVSDDSYNSLALMHSFILKAAKDIATASGSRITVIPAMKGSTSLVAWQNGANRLDRATLFGSANYRALQAAPSGLNCIFWYGHETQIARNYKEAWYTLHRRLREERGANLPLIYAQLGASTSQATISTAHIPHSDILRRAELNRGSDLVIGAKILDVNFSDAAQWTAGVPTGFTVSGSDANNTVTYTANGALLSGDGSKSLSLNKAAIFTNGQKYLIEAEVYSVTAGSFKLVYAGETYLYAAYYYRVAFTASQTLLQVFRSNSGVANVITLKSLKVWQYTSGEATEPLPLSHMVVTFDQPLIDDQHLNTTGYIEVGRRFALAYRQYVLGHTVNGTGPRLEATGAFTHPSADKSKVIVKFDKEITTGGATNYNGQFRVYDGVTEMTVSSAVRDTTDTTAVLITMSATASGTVAVSYGDLAVASTGITLLDVVKDTDLMPAPTFAKQTVV